MKYTRLFTKEDWDKGLRPTSLRNGDKIDFIKHYPQKSTHTMGETFRVVTSCGDIFTLFDNGKYYKFDPETSGYDLVIEIQAKEYWMNVYKDGVGGAYDSKDMAEFYSRDGRVGVYHITHAEGYEPLIEYIPITESKSK